MIRWRIFYEDDFWQGTDPATAPTHGVIAIVQKLDDEPRCQVIHTCDYFWWRDGMWWGGDLSGFLDSSARGATWVKQGRTIRSSRFADILGEAAEFSHGWDE